MREVRRVRAKRDSERGRKGTRKSERWRKGWREGTERGEYGECGREGVEKVLAIVLV